MRSLASINSSAIVFAAHLVVAGTSANAESVLLASYDFTSVGGHAPESDPRVEFILQLPTSSPPGGTFGLGSALDNFWKDGDQGFFDFTSETDDAFDNFAAAATNGIAEKFSVIDLFSSGSGGATAPAPESELFGTSPDLVRYEVELVRLIVQDINVDPWVPDPDSHPEIKGFQHQTRLTYEFYGSVVPEPSSIVFIVVGTSLLHRRLMPD